jgi:lysophospholipase L1-like esterase
MLVRFHSDVIDLKPAVVHIMAGTNDVAGNTGLETDAEIQAYVSAMVEIAKAHDIRVVLASIPPAKAFPWKPLIAPAERIRGLNAWLRRYAAEQRVTYVDYWSALAAPDGGMKPEFARDGVHPTAEGYAAMRPLAEAAIARALGRR